MDFVVNSGVIVGSSLSALIFSVFGFSTLAYATALIFLISGIYAALLHHETCFNKSDPQQSNQLQKSTIPFSSMVYFAILSGSLLITYSHINYSIPLYMEEHSLTNLVGYMFAANAALVLALQFPVMEIIHKLQLSQKTLAITCVIIATILPIIASYISWSQTMMLLTLVLIISVLETIIFPTLPSLAAYIGDSPHARSRLTLLYTFIRVISLSSAGVIIPLLFNNLGIAGSIAVTAIPSILVLPMFVFVLHRKREASK
jgi:hypothetical protein